MRGPVRRRTSEVAAKLRNALEGGNRARAVRGPVQCRAVLAPSKSHSDSAERNQHRSEYASIYGGSGRRQDFT